jgi:hypothetical protein
MIDRWPPENRYRKYTLASAVKNETDLDVGSDATLLSRSDVSSWRD